MRKYTNRLCCLILLTVFLGATLPSEGSELMDWMVGEWEGVRRDGEDSAPIQVVLLEMPDGKGLFERLEVQLEKSSYVGVSVLTEDPKSGLWVKFYTNPVRPKIARLEGKRQGDVLVLKSVSPERKRESRLKSERRQGGLWVRTQEISEDGGKTWKTLFADELRRSGPEASNSKQPWIKEVQGPQYFALYVEDVDRSVDWYVQALGLKKLGGSSAQDGSWRIENLGNDAVSVEIIRDDRATAVDRAIGFRKIGFFVRDLEAVADRVESATGDRPRIVEFEQLNQRILQIRDPDDNTLQLMSRLRASD